MNTKPTTQEAAQIIIWSVILAFNTFCPFFGQSYIAVLLSKVALLFCSWMVFRSINTVFVRLTGERMASYQIVTDDMIVKLKQYIEIVQRELNLVYEKCQLLQRVMRENGLDGDNVEVIYPPSQKKPNLPS